MDSVDDTRLFVRVSLFMHLIFEAIAQVFLTPCSTMRNEIFGPSGENANCSGAPQKLILPRVTLLSQQ